MPASAVGHRPQSLLLNFFSALLVDSDLPPLPSGVLLDLLAGLGVTEAAARATLGRMTRSGLLTRGQVGRTADYALTPLAEDLLSRTRDRMVSPAPFLHPAGEWTLLSYSMAEDHRGLRQRVRSRLSDAGFGRLRDGLWIVPGTVDITAVLGHPDLADATGLADAFVGRPLPGTDVHRLVHRAWDVPLIRAAHTRFIDTWSRPPRVHGSLARLALLTADWLGLLRADPGLPPAHLDPWWPAAVSTVTYQRAVGELQPVARAALERSSDPRYRLRGAVPIAPRARGRAPVMELAEECRR